MKHESLASRVLPAILSGLARSPLPLAEIFGDLIDPYDPKANLKALSLTGQFLRFQRPPLATLTAQTIAEPDPRPLLSDDQRLLLKRLITSAEGPNTSLMTAAVANAIDAAGMAPHPYDFGFLEAFISTYAELLGVNAFAYAQRGKTEPEQASFFAWSSLDDSDWSKAPIGQRERYLRQRRQEDAAAGLNLVIAEWSQCNADVRLRLLNCLRVGLSAADSAFLEGLAKDRAPRVREVAARLLAQLGQSSDAASLSMLLERVKQGQAGMLRKKRSLSLEFPANVGANKRITWIFENFSQLSLGQIAKALDCSPAELVQSAAKDEGLLLILLLAASNDKDFTSLSSIAAILPDAWSALVVGGFAEMPIFSSTELVRWVDCVVHPRDWPADIDGSWPRKLFECMERRPLDPAEFKGLLRSNAAKSALRAESAAALDFLGALTLLCPPSLHKELLTSIPIDIEETTATRRFLELMISLEEPRHE